MPSLSVVIIAQDEERTIGRVLESVKPICSEVILVDSGSKDRTIAIATDYGARVFNQSWLGYGRQKNFAIDLATSEWVLSLDADEVLTAPLAGEIDQLLKRDAVPPFDAYRIPRLLFIGDNPVHHYAYETVAEFANAMDKYARLSAQEYLGAKNSDWKASSFNELVHPPWTMFYRYILRGGILDGALGLRLNLIYADYVRSKIRYLRELKRLAGSR